MRKTVRGGRGLLACGDDDVGCVAAHRVVDGLHELGDGAVAVEAQRSYVGVVEKAGTLAGQDGEYLMAVVDEFAHGPADQVGPLTPAACRTSAVSGDERVSAGRGTVRGRRSTLAAMRGVM
jgi:hypothetical protein